MTEMEFASIDVDGLEVFVNRCDLRRDLHIFCDYVERKDIKRSHRTNYFPKTDALKLAKLMSDPDAINDIRESGYSQWLDYIDKLALKLGFVKYDLEGRYMGYSSVETSYPDNYIKFLPETYNDFLKLTIDKQEQRVLSALVDDYHYDNNEFIKCKVPGRLDRFDYRGCAIGVLPTLDFAVIRKFLLNYISNLESNKWYSVESLVKFLKKEHPYFLIPKDFKVESKYDKRERYFNFPEHIGNRWGNEVIITEGEPDAFERVEGRYVERFLESIPLAMQYLDVAYGQKKDDKIFPSRNLLKAFKLKDRFFRVMRGEIPRPKVTVLPNFEIHVDSDIYPAGIMSSLKPLTDVKSDDKVITLKLQKQKILGELVRNKDLDVASLLKELSHRELPQNILVELDNWCGHSEIFTLFEGAGLFEGKLNLPELEKYTIEKISPAMRIVNLPDKLFQYLEKEEYIPLKVVHSEKSLQSLPDGVNTAFAKKTKRASVKSRKSVSLKCEDLTVLYFPIAGLYEVFCKELVRARCPFQTDQQRLTITLSKKLDSNVKDIIKTLKDDYLIKMEDF